MDIQYNKQIETLASRLEDPMYKSMSKLEDIYANVFLYYTKCSKKLNLPKEFCEQIENHLTAGNFIVTFYPAMLGLRHFENDVFKNLNISEKIEKLSELHVKVKEGYNLYKFTFLGIKSDPLSALPKEAYVWAIQPEDIFKNEVVQSVIDYKSKLKIVNKITKK